MCLTRVPPLKCAHFVGRPELYAGLGGRLAFVQGIKCIRRCRALHLVLIEATKASSFSDR